MWPLSRSGRRGRKASENDDRVYSPLATSPEASRNRVVGQTIGGQAADDNAEDDEDDEEELLPSKLPDRPTSYFDQRHAEDDDEEAQEEQDENADEDAVDTPLLPIFSAALLDRLPLYNITHAIRLLILQRCETTLSWDQLRSPQISQFLVKPIQNQISANHFNRATLCGLISNCLQFRKESQLNPGNVGVLQTRALVSELLAMRLIKEFSTRELIDALSYDFDPLQGMNGINADGTAAPAWQDVQGKRTQAKGARVSTIEIAIRAQAKRFLAHPLVVQHLEAIWAGNVVFHSESDNLHRKPPIEAEEDQKGKLGAGYGTVGEQGPIALPADAVLSRKARGSRPSKTLVDGPMARRTVTIYDPRDASLFKLSRLRVPRYRQIFTTLSFATMLGLFLAVLYQRSLDITPLEVVFWFWSAGYMLDEVVGFSEQGFGLYILSFWNAIDLGILLLFVVYYCLRLYGIVLAEQGKHRISSMAYDALASTAVLLFPRLFSVLDHYRYFSQLLIAFRMMAQDLAAILILILISCSGFFVAFTFSFSDEKTDGNAVAYALFQILMGFTPAAWEKWSGYNVLGKAIMAIFLIICHFLIVTILITVLTNSFMAIVRNADEEHQFLFAVNTISMVKSDALFSYIAPTNVIGWILSPLRFLLPFRLYVKLNRTIIKITHSPVLFVIFTYERVVLSGFDVGTTDLIEKPVKTPRKPLVFTLDKAQEVFSPGTRLREPSVISFHKDRALEEVFRRPFKGSTRRTTTRGADGERTTVVDNWMQLAENEGGASPPLEQPRSVVERLEDRRPAFRRAATANQLRRLNQRSREFTSGTKSAMSDPDLMSLTTSRRPQRIDEESEPLEISMGTLPQETDVDGDDEIENNDESDNDITPVLGESAVSIANKENRTPGENEDDDGDESEFFQTPTAGKSPFVRLSSAAQARLQHLPDIGQTGRTPSQAQPRGTPHQSRNTSSATMLFAPLGEEILSSTPLRISRATTAKNANSGGTVTPTPANFLSGQRTPNFKPLNPTKPRPIMSPRQKTAPSAGVGFTFIEIARRAQREPSFNARALDLASEIGDNKWGPVGLDPGGISGMPASFSEQLLRERDLERRREDERRRSELEEKGMVSRIMLARMHTLEEGFREVLREIKDMSHANTSRRESDADSDAHLAKHRRPRPDTAGSLQSQGSGAAAPIGRIGGHEGRGKKNPRKLQRRGFKGKEPERPGTAMRDGGGSPAIEQFAVAQTRKEDLDAVPGVEQPPLASGEQRQDRGD